MVEAKTYNYGDRAQIRELLMGRRVVAVEMFDSLLDLRDALDAEDYVWGYAGGKMTLDDGRVVYVAPNQGGCACSAGDYFLKSLERVDNIITRVDFETVEVPDPDYPDTSWASNTAYRIFVFADNERINLLSVEGDDGNGYYGTGYELVVVAP